MTHQLERRRFLKLTGVLAASQLIARPAGAVSANSKLRTAHIGVGGMGAADLRSIASHAQVEVAALCDVDGNRLGQAAEQHPRAEKFADYRQLFDSLGDQIDAVVVSTPDHTHAPAAMRALQLSKPVYCQKPLTHAVYEARRLREVATEKNVPTQMGVQVHSSAPYRRATQMIQDGVIGKVSQVHAWSHKDWGYNGPAPSDPTSPPDSLAWNLWLGVADERKYAKDFYHPGQWRRLIDFGTGTLGDMGVHIFDTPYRALALTAPRWVKTTCRPPTGVGHPNRVLVEFEFPQTDYTTESLSWRWYDGSFAPPDQDDLGIAEDAALPDQGSLFVGEEGRLLLPHVGEPVLMPEEKFRDYERPEVEDGNHYHQWVDACLGEGECSADFAYAGQLTEALLLGVVGARYPDEQLKWDPAAMEVTNKPEANQFLRREYRKGFEVAGL